METLPLEILTTIAATDYTVWRGMLVVRPFAEYTLSSECRSYVLRIFCRKKICLETKCDPGYIKNYLDKRSHSFFDLPAIELTDKPPLLWWRHHEKCHRGSDLPAIIYPDGSSFWYRDGKRHRDGDLPAEICPDGTRKWYRAGELHRDRDLPAVTHSSGVYIWYRDGKMHRDGDLPAKIYPDGKQTWYQNGKKHRSGNRPAVIYPCGKKKYYKNGRRCGPADAR